MQPRRYLILALALASALTCGIVAVNANFDPYGLDAHVTHNVYRGEADGERPGAFWRMAKSARDARPRTVILGTSRGEAIDPRHAGFTAEDAPAVNLSLGAVSIEQMRLLLMHAHAASSVRRAIVGLDLEAFQGAGRPDFDPAGLDGNPESEPHLLVSLRINLSREALSASLANAMTPGAAEPRAQAGGERADPRSRGVADVPIARLYGQRGLIWFAEFNNFYSQLPYLFPYWTPGTRWNSDARRAASMKAFRNLLEFARKEGIELRLFISPVHARYLEWYRRVGWSPLFEAWKRALVAELEEESRAVPSRPAFPLWDFSGYNRATLEPVPKGGDLSTRMRWYEDSSHYSPRWAIWFSIGFSAGRPQTPRRCRTRRIDGATIKRHLSILRGEADRFRLIQPDEVADVGDSYVRLRRATRK